MNVSARLATAGAVLIALATGPFLAAADTNGAEKAKSAPSAAAPDGMALVPGGKFRMGRDGGPADEAPVHEVTLDPFWLDRREVTNRAFEAFVKATGHVTQAERDGKAWIYRFGADSFRLTEGADWRHPNGPETSIAHLMDHPVALVSWEDAASYARWAGKRLPTEAEWEYAARSGKAGHLRARTDERAGPGVVDANVWQGHWPEKNLKTDDYFYTSPAGTYAANAWGIHDMIGNVWEWCSDWYGANTYSRSTARNPTGPATGQNRVARGGSWFCSPNYCGAYTTHFRGASPSRGAFNNVGFRCARDVAPDSKETR